MASAKSRVQLFLEAPHGDRLPRRRALLNADAFVGIFLLGEWLVPAIPDPGAPAGGVTQ